MLFALYVGLIWDKLFQDFWTDEIYTLKYFVLVSPRTTVTDYHVPNNHIFFSLLLNIYSLILNIRTLSEIFQTPYLVRALPFVFSLGTIFYAYKIGRLASGKNAGILSASILIFTLSFYEFSLQLRGYSLSLFFVSLLVFLSLSHLVEGAKYKIVLTIPVVTLLSYTIPLNFYFVLGLFFAVIIRSIVVSILETRSSTLTSLFSSRSITLLLAIGIGVTIALVCYIPVLKEIFDNQYVSPEGFDIARSINSLYVVASGFLSRRSVLIVLTFLGIIFLLKHQFRTTKNLNLLFIVLVFIIPFIISAIRGDNPPPRAFVNLVPIFSVMIGVLISRALNRTHYQILFLSLFIAYGVVSFYYERHRLSGIVQNNLHKAHGPSRAQELNYAYYSYSYEPLQQIREFLRVRQPGITLIVGDAEPNGLEEYLRSANVEFELTGLSIPDIDNRPWEGPSLKELAHKYPEGFYFVTRFPNRLFRDLVEQQLAVKVVSLSSKLTYHNFFYIKPS
jgi:hypothetical protein